MNEDEIEKKIEDGAADLINAISKEQAGEIRDEAQGSFETESSAIQQNTSLLNTNTQAQNANTQAYKLLNDEKQRALTLQQALDAAVEKSVKARNEMIVYHGTGADFNQFDRRFLNTGAGNGEYFGAGIYTTGSKKIAQEYTEEISNNTGNKAEIYSDLFRSNNVNDFFKSKIERVVSIKKALEEINKDSKYLDYTEKSADLKKYIDSKFGGLLKEDIVKIINERTESLSRELKTTIDFLSDVKLSGGNLGKLVENYKANLMTVAIPNDDGNFYFDWSKKFDIDNLVKDNNSPSINKILLKMKKNHKGNSVFGSDVINALYEELGINDGAEAVTKLARNLGYGGVKYPAKEDNPNIKNIEGVTNYVVFDPEKVKILKTEDLLGSSKNNIFLNNNEDTSLYNPVKYIDKAIKEIFDNSQLDGSKLILDIAEAARNKIVENIKSNIISGSFIVGPSMSATDVTKVQDMILTKDGRLIETSPDDTLVALKNPGLSLKNGEQYLRDSDRNVMGVINQQQLEKLNELLKFRSDLTKSKTPESIQKRKEVDSEIKTILTAARGTQRSKEQDLRFSLESEAAAKELAKNIQTSNELLRAVDKGINNRVIAENELAKSLHESFVKDSLKLQNGIIPDGKSLYSNAESVALDYETGKKFNSRVDNIISSNRIAEYEEKYSAALVPVSTIKDYSEVNLNKLVKDMEPKILGQKNMEEKIKSLTGDYEIIEYIDKILNEYKNSDLGSRAVKSGVINNILNSGIFGLSSGSGVEDIVNEYINAKQNINSKVRGATYNQPEIDYSYYDDDTSALIEANRKRTELEFQKYEEEMASIEAERERIRLFTEVNKQLVDHEIKAEDFQSRAVKSEKLYKSLEKGQELVKNSGLGDSLLREIEVKLASFKSYENYVVEKGVSNFAGIEEQKNLNNYKNRLSNIGYIGSWDAVENERLDELLKENPDVMYRKRQHDDGFEIFSGSGLLGDVGYYKDVLDSLAKDLDNSDLSLEEKTRLTEIATLTNQKYIQSLQDVIKYIDKATDEENKEVTDSKILNLKGKIDRLVFFILPMHSVDSISITIRHQIEINSSFLSFTSPTSGSR
mgnify:CR=1 FL=1